MNHPRETRTGRLSPRVLSRWIGVLALTLVIGVAIAACGGDDDSGGSSGSAKSLNILTWETYHDKKWLDEFKKQTGIEVKATNVGSPAEMFSKVKANPGQFDIVLATAGWFDQYVKAGLLEPVDESRIPNLANIKLGFPWKDATSALMSV